MNLPFVSIFVVAISAGRVLGDLVGQEFLFETKPQFTHVCPGIGSTPELRCTEKDYTGIIGCLTGPEVLSSRVWCCSPTEKFCWAPSKQCDPSKPRQKCASDGIEWCCEAETEDCQYGNARSKVYNQCTFKTQLFLNPLEVGSTTQLTLTSTIGGGAKTVQPDVTPTGTNTNTWSTLVATSTALATPSQTAEEVEVQDSEKQDSKLKPGVVAGVTAGGLVGVAGAAVGLFLYLSRRRHQRGAAVLDDKNDRPESEFSDRHKTYDSNGFHSNFEPARGDLKSPIRSPLGPAVYVPPRNDANVTQNIEAVFPPAEPRVVKTEPEPVYHVAELEAKSKNWI